MIAQARFERTLVGDRDLLFRQRHPRNIRAGEAREVEAETTPSATDVEHVLAGLDGEFGRDVPLLCELRFLEGLCIMLEIGTGILPIFIQEERIELVSNVVMMRDIAPGTLRIVALLERP